MKLAILLFFFLNAILFSQEHKYLIWDDLNVTQEIFDQKKSNIISQKYTIKTDTINYHFLIPSIKSGKLDSQELSKFKKMLNEMNIDFKRDEPLFIVYSKSDVKKIEEMHKSIVHIKNHPYQRKSYLKRKNISPIFIYDTSIKLTKKDENYFIDENRILLDLPFVNFISDLDYKILIKKNGEYIVNVGEESYYKFYEDIMSEEWDEKIKEYLIDTP